MTQENISIDQVLDNYGLNLDDEFVYHLVDGSKISGRIKKESPKYAHAIGEELAYVVLEDFQDEGNHILWRNVLSWKRLPSNTDYPRGH